MKSTPIKRRTPLTVHPDRARAFVQRNRKSLKRGKRKHRLVVPPETRMRARARSEGRCVVCAYRGHQGRGSGKAEHLHHVLPVAKWPLLELVSENLVGCCAQDHMDHEHGTKRIPLAALPDCVFALAEDVGPAAVDYLLARYPQDVGERRPVREAG